MRSSRGMCISSLPSSRCGVQMVSRCARRWKFRIPRRAQATACFQRREHCDATGRLVQLDQGSEEWHEKRMNLLTASDCANAAGFFGSEALERLWREKVTKINSFSGNDMTRHGNAHEHFALRDFATLFGREVRPGLFYEQLAAGGFLGVSPDGHVSFRSGEGLLEMKCPSKADNEFGPEFAEPPQNLKPWYYMQIQQQLAVANLELAGYWSWTLNKGCLLVRVDRDREFWNQLYPLLCEFWDCVEAGRQVYALNGTEHERFKCASHLHVVLWEQK